MSRELLKQALLALQGYRRNHDDYQPCDAEKQSKPTSPSLIHAWAEGAEIECYHEPTNAWTPTNNPTWGDNRKYRIKQEPKWYENIPAHGVLCWVSDNNENPDSRNNGVLITRYYAGWYENREIKWRYATPLTDDEIAPEIFE